MTPGSDPSVPDLDAGAQPLAAGARVSLDPLALADFLESLAHDLRSPLGVVSGAFAALGASFFGSGIAAQRLLRGALGDALVIHPQPWPPGIEIGGTFGVP